MPVKVWREVVKIQRNFFWGGLSNRNRMCLVKWAEICKPKKDGSLGIKDLRLEVNEIRSHSSGWWRDICRLDRGIGWFEQAATKRVGNGSTTRFWKEVWIGNQSLETRFPRLFGISTQKEALVSEMGSWENGVWRWGLLWRRIFFVWEEELVDELMGVLALVTITTLEDRWSWNPGGEEGFTVKSTYVFLDHTTHPSQTIIILALVCFQRVSSPGGGVRFLLASHCCGSAVFVPDAAFCFAALVVVFVEEQEEIMKARASSQKRLSIKEIKKMVYLSQVIDETLRLAGIFSVFREATTDLNINGFFIPKGWKVIVWLRAIHMDHEYHSNPQEFNPARWNDYNSATGTYIPFGIGPWFCPGGPHPIDNCSAKVVKLTTL
ncbi:beta-amyrin 11-oxidase [Trifolium repens]|nr:beta-amyrin 11-oxidase [Trifolium repens]